MGSEPKNPKSLSLPLITQIKLWFMEILIRLAVRKDGTVIRWLLNLLPLYTPANSEPTNGVKTYDVVMDQARQLWFRVFVPTQNAAEDLPVMVFFHGGGYAFLSPDTTMYDEVCRKFARELPAVVVSFDYPLTPENRHPLQHEGGLELLKLLDSKENRAIWLPENANISRCFIGGDSAGGHMTHYVCQRALQFNFQELKVMGLVVIQPFFGGEERTDSEKRLNGLVPLLTLQRTDWLWNSFMPLDEPFTRDDAIINVSGPNAADISKLDFPPTFVVAAGYDILRDWQIKYYKWLKNSGKEAYLVDYPNMFHSFYLFSELPESDQLIAEVKDFLQKVLIKV